MISRCLITCLALAISAACAQGAAFFFSFDTQPDGNGAFTNMVTTNAGFQGTPQVSYTRTAHNETENGGTTFTDLWGVEWIGSGGTGVPGHSVTYNPGSTGNTFTVGFSTLGLTDVELRFDYRAGRTSGAYIAGFSAFEYSLDQTTWVAINGTNLSFPQLTSYQTFTADLSGLNVIENASQVWLRWTIPDLASPQSLRIDNFLVTAMPEPSRAMLGMFGLALLVWRRNRKNGCLH